MTDEVKPQNGDKKIPPSFVFGKIHFPSHKVGLYAPDMKIKFKSVFKTPCFYFIMLLPTGLLLLAAARFVPGFADFYYRTFYRFFGGIFGSITGILLFSLMEAGIAALIFLLIYWIVRLVLKAKEDEKAVLKYFGSVLKSIVSLVCLLLFLFCAFCGTNYYRAGFADEMGLEVKESSVDELYDLCEFLLDEAIDSGNGLYRGEDNVTVFDKENFSMANEAKAEFEKFCVDMLIKCGAVSLSEKSSYHKSLAVKGLCEKRRQRIGLMDKKLAVVCAETAAEIFCVDPTEIYSGESFGKSILAELTPFEEKEENPMAVLFQSAKPLNYKLGQIGNFDSRDVVAYLTNLWLELTDSESPNRDLRTLCRFIPKEFFASLYISFLKTKGE